MQKVNPNFHARICAKSRTYVYRLAYLKDGKKLWSDHEEAIKAQKTKQEAVDGENLEAPFLVKHENPFKFRAFSNVFDRNFLTEIS